MKKPVAEIDPSIKVADDFPIERPEGMDMEMWRALRTLHNKRIKMHLRGVVDEDRSKAPIHAQKEKKTLSGRPIKQSKIKSLCPPSYSVDEYAKGEQDTEKYKEVFTPTPWLKRITQWLRDRLNSR